MERPFLLLLVIGVFSVSVCVGALPWPCTYTDPQGNNYDLTSQNGNTSDPEGLYFTYDLSLLYTYYFQLCNFTTVTPNAQSSFCKANTQVCVEQPDGSGPDVSCGVGPPTISGDSTELLLKTYNGDVGCETTPRSTTIYLRCPTQYNRQNNDIDYVAESPACTYLIYLYIDSACATKPSHYSPSRCCTYQNDTQPDDHFAICPSSQCPSANGYSLTHFEKVLDCSHCHPYYKAVCCIYTSSSGIHSSSCVTSGQCPQSQGKSELTTYFSTTDCSTCQPFLS